MSEDPRVGELTHAIVSDLVDSVADSLSKGSFSRDVQLVCSDGFLEALHAFAISSRANAAIAGKLAWILRGEGALVLESRLDEIDDRLAEVEDVGDWWIDPRPS